MDWLNIEKVVIFNGKDENGNRYLSQFLRDYKEVFNPDYVNAGCEKCLNDYYTKFIKYLNMGNDKEEKKYVLKAKYNGIPLKFGSPVLVTNSNITKQYAETLAKNHPRGKDLFDVYPEEVEKKPRQRKAKKQEYNE